MNYKLVVAGNQFNGNAGTKACDDAGKARMESVPGKDYILLPLWDADPPFSQILKSSPDAGFKPSSDDGKKVDEDLRNSKGIDQEKEDNVTSTNNVNAANINEVNAVCGKISIKLPNDPNMPPLEDIVYSDDDEDVGAEADINNLDAFMPASPILTTRVRRDHPDPSWIEAMHDELLQFKLQKIWILVDLPNGKRPIGTKWVFGNKKDERGIVIKNKAILVAHGYTQEEGIDYDEVFAHVARIEAIMLFLAYASFKDFVVYQMDVKSDFLYGKIEEEVYVCQPPGFEDPDFPDRVYKVEKALYGLHQAPRAWYETLSTYLLDNWFQRGKIDKNLFIRRDKVKQKEDGIFISQDKYVTEILKKFGFTNVKTVSTPMETQKLLLKDKDGEEVDVHLFRSMISSLMYLTSSRLDIMFAVCACARYQVNPKVSHLYAVKRIFRYLKGQPKLGLWYLKYSPFDLVAYTDSDYARASLNRKSTTGGCQFLRCRLISWQCKKQTVVANSTIEAEYVAALSCYGQVLWIQYQLLDYGHNFMHTKIFIDNNSTICIIKNPVFHSKTKHIEIRHHFIRDCNEKKLIQMVKIHTDKNVAYLLTKAFDFWATIKAKTINREVQLQALVDGKKIIITESIVRRDLQLKDAEGIECLPNATIFEQFTLMGAKTTTWNEYSSTMVSAIICLVTNQKFNFSKYIFESMVKNLENVSDNVADEAVNEEIDDSLERDATTATSLDAEQDRGNINKTQSKVTTNEPSSLGTSSSGGLRRPEIMRAKNVSKHSNDPLLARGNTLRSGKDRLKLEELMEFCTKLQQRVLDLENRKTTQAQEITSLKPRVKKLEKKGGSRTHKLTRLYKVGRSARMVSSDDASLGDQEDASKQGRKIDDIDKDAEITLIDETQGRYSDDLMFDTSVLDDEEVFAGHDMDEKEINVAENEVSTTDPVTTTSEVVTSPTKTTTADDLTLAQNLIEIRNKGKGIMEEPEKPTKKKDQIRHDEEVAQRLQAQMQAELEEEDRLVRQREEEANIVS
ncbi:putative ribonuclease H-like domain-containing protein [Tanacetum coccineum]